MRPQLKATVPAVHDGRQSPFPQLPATTCGVTHHPPMHSATHFGRRWHRTSATRCHSRESSSPASGGLWGCSVWMLAWVQTSAAGPKIKRGGTSVNGSPSRNTLCERAALANRLEMAGSPWAGCPLISPSLCTFLGKGGHARSLRAAGREPGLGKGLHADMAGSGTAQSWWDGRAWGRARVLETGTSPLFW